MTVTQDDLKRYRRYLNEETDGIFIYRELAAIEQDETLRDVYERLAEVEIKHLELWQEQLRKAGADDSVARPSYRARVMMAIARRFGAAVVIPVIKTFEADADAMYAGDPIAEAAGLPADERQHYRIFSALEQRGGGISGSVIGRIESRHRSLGGGNALRAAVLGANDGLVSNLALVMGFAGAATGQATIVLAGLAGLVAGAFSMALGEWISVTSSREAAEAQIAAEAEELELMPEAEQEELALIYQAKGLQRAEAEQLAERMMQNPETALNTLIREELGLDPQDLGSPWVAGFTSLLLFSIGAVIPVTPFFFLDGISAIATSAVASSFGLFMLGGAITLFTGRSALYAGSRQVILGLIAAAATFGIGSLIGEVAGI